MFVQKDNYTDHTYNYGHRHHYREYAFMLQVSHANRITSRIHIHVPFPFLTFILHVRRRGGVYITGKPMPWIST